MKQFGVELTDLNGKFVGPFEAVKRLRTSKATGRTRADHYSRFAVTGTRMRFKILVGTLIIASLIRVRYRRGRHDGVYIHDFSESLLA